VADGCFGHAPGQQGVAYAAGMATEDKEHRAAAGSSDHAPGTATGIIGQAAASARLLGGVATQLAGAAASQAAEQVATLTSLLPTVMNQLSSVEARVSALNARLDQLDARLDQLDERLLALTEQTSGLRTDLNKTRRTIDRVRELERQRDQVVATLGDVAIDLPKRTRRALLGIVGLGHDDDEASE